MNLSDISTQLMFTTVPIWVEKAGGLTSTGTAFIYNVPVANQPGQLIPLLVTNRHVVEGARNGLIELVERDGDAPRQTRLRAAMPAEMILKYTDEELDLVAVPLGPLLNQLETEKKPVFFRSIGPELIPNADAVSELAALEEIVFVGYPSGLRDRHSGMPIIRRGITATPVWNDLDNTPMFLIDAGVFPGSSGSPVFILNQGAYATKGGLTVGNRLLFLGVITQSMLRPEKNGAAYLGLGKVVKSTALKPFIERVVDEMQRAK